MRGPVAALALALALSGPASSAPDYADARIAAFEVRSADGVLSVSYRVEGALPDLVVERLQSGFELRYEHRVELVSKRAWWANRVWELAVFETAASYDSLTHRYVVERQAPGAGGSEVADRRVTESLDDVVAFLTEVRDLRVAVPAEFPAGEPLEVRVSCRLGRRWLLWMFPASWSVQARAEVVR